MIWSPSKLEEAGPMQDKRSASLQCNYPGMHSDNKSVIPWKGCMQSSSTVREKFVVGMKAALGTCF